MRRDVVDARFSRQDRWCAVVIPPTDISPFEFVVVSALRAQQLLAGSVPRVAGEHNAPTKAQMEVAQGHVTRANGESPAPAPQCLWQL